MTVETKLWDPADRLTTPEAIAAYLEAVLEDGDPALIAAALGDVARSPKPQNPLIVYNKG